LKNRGPEKGKPRPEGKRGPSVSEAGDVIETTRPRFGQKYTESRPELEAARRTATQSSRNLYDSSHDAARAPVYRMLNYERNHSQAKGAQMPVEMNL
jgi:hypothetical protein